MVTLMHELFRNVKIIHNYKENICIEFVDVTYPHIY